MLITRLQLAYRLERTLDLFLVLILFYSPILYTLLAFRFLGSIAFYYTYSIFVMLCATYTSRIGWRAYKTFQPAVSPVARHCYLFGGLYGQVGWSLGITISLTNLTPIAFIRPPPI